MINSISELKNFPLLFVLYYAGSSGEFLSDTLSQCFDHLHSPGSVWENEHRVKFEDFFGRSLNEGTSLVPEDVIVQRANHYLNNFNPETKTCIAMVHPRPDPLNFVKTYFDNSPVIEITSCNELSKRFRLLARRSKIENTVLGDAKVEYNTLSVQRHDMFKHQLMIEWEDLIIHDPANSFVKIQEFLGHSGSQETFMHCVEDYKKRNQTLLDICYEKHHPENIW